MLAPHGGCNWRGCKICFPHLMDKPPLTDEQQYNRAVEVANGDYLRYGESLDPIAVARHAVKLIRNRG